MTARTQTLDDEAPAARIATVDVAGVTFVADLSGALFWEEQSLLVVSDLHLEKGSSFAARGVLLPPYDTVATLGRLAAVVARHAPRMVIALGDSFHDRSAHGRLSVPDRDTIAGLQTARDWIWIAGNHDPNIPTDAGGERLPALDLGPLYLRHEPRAGMQHGEIAGHLHPIARIAGKRRRCLITDGSRAVVPAFGAYAGGLNIHDEAFHPLFPNGRKRAHVLAENQVFQVCATRCHPEELLRPIAWGMNPR